MKRNIALAATLLALTSPAMSEPDYKDDRSTAANLIASLYNAINRHEYARAYDYFATPPNTSYDAYVKGYAETESVDVITGETVADGTAGSTYYTVPTAIRARDTKGGISYFAGCYTVRAVNGNIQDPPNRPLQIDSAKLKPAKEEDYGHYTLPDCSKGQGAADDGTSDGMPDDATLIERAKTAFVRDMAGQCDKAADTAGGANEPDLYQIKYKPSYATAEDPDSLFAVLVFACSMAAYNSSEVYYGYDTVEGLRLLSFAAPHLDLKYEDEEQSKLKSMAIDGFTSSALLTNSEYDEKTQTINHFAKWRGIGDAADHAAYKFVEGQFVLKDYDVDPTTDEEMNPWQLIKDGAVLPKPELIPDEAQ